MRSYQSQLQEFRYASLRYYTSSANGMFRCSTSILLTSTELAQLCKTQQRLHALQVWPLADRTTMDTAIRNLGRENVRLVRNLTEVLVLSNFEHSLYEHLHEVIIDAFPLLHTVEIRTLLTRIWIT